MSGASDHLPRLLALVPWLLSHPDTPIEAAAAEFGVSPKQLRADLDLIWMCGLPGHGPGDLIDVWISGDRVTLSNAETIAAPLRLTPAETIALVAALRALSAMPGIADAESVERALGKLEASAGSVATDRVAAVGAGSDEETTARVRRALSEGKRLRIDYFVPARDEITHRDVDPIRLHTAGAATYLVGWCRLAGGSRTFRLDRIVGVEVLDLPAEIPPEAVSDAPDDTLFTPSATDRLVRFELSPSGRWVIDYYPTESVEEHADGRLTVTLRARDDDWLRRMALNLAGVGKLVEPAEIAATVAENARETLARYHAE